MCQMNVGAWRNSCRICSILYCMVLCSLVNVRNTYGQGQGASGNAMDLAKMNMQLMNANSKCIIPMCQSVCQEMDSSTRCFVCNSACTSGSIMEPNIPGQLNPLGPRNGGGFRGCGSNWMQCPVHCNRVYNVVGCLRCVCLHSSSTQTGTYTTRLNHVTSHTPSSMEQVTTTPRTQATPETKTPTTAAPSLLPSSTATTTASSSYPASTVLKPTPSSMPTISRTASTKPKEGHLRDATTTSTSIYVTLKNSTSPNGIYNQAEDRIEGQQQRMKDEQNSARNIKYIIIISVVSVLLLVSVTVSVVVSIAWRRSLQHLRKNKDELYFVHKAYRHDSTARLHDNMTEPVYAHVQQRPEVPPRTPPVSPLSPSAPSTELLLRTVSTSSETSVKETIDEARHDYLELI